MIRLTVVRHSLVYNLNRLDLQQQHYFQEYSIYVGQITQKLLCKLTLTSEHR